MKGVNLSAWALNHQPLIRFFIVITLLSGLYAYFTLGRMEDPEITIKGLIIQVYWPGATAREMALQVTDELEKKLQETPGLDYLSSYTKPGESTILVGLAEWVPPADVPKSWAKVRDLMDDVRPLLPQGIFGPFFNDQFGEVFGSIYAFTGEGFDHAELRRHVERARQELLRVDTVSRVDILGVQDEKIYVEVSDNKLASLGLSPLPLFSALQEQSALEPAGTVTTASDRVWARVSGTFDSLDSIRDLGLAANGHIFRLGDIASVRRTYEDPPAYTFRYNGQPAIALAISMRKGGDIIALGRNLDARLAELRADLPLGIDYHKVSDQPRVVQESIDEFMQTFLEALAIVMAMSFFSLGLRTGLVVALCIPLVLALTFLIMKITGLDLQRISLGSLVVSLGLLVDDAIIAVEMMALKLEEGYDRFRAATFAYESTAFPMLTGTLITVAGFLPIALAQSNAGEYTFSIFAVVGIALLTSWVVAVLFTPYIGYRLLPEHKTVHDEQVIYSGPFYRAFRRLVEWCLRWRWLVIVLTVAAYGTSLWAFQFVPQQFFPSSARPELLVDMWLPEGSSFAATETQVAKLEKALQGDDNIINYASFVGGGAPRFYLPMDLQLRAVNFAQIIIMTKGGEAREAVLDKLQKLFDEDFPRVRGRVTRLENGPPVGYPVQFRVVGEDPEVLRRIATEVAVVMRDNPYTRNVNNDWNERIKVVRLEVDQDKARALGMSSLDLARNLNLLLSGLRVTQYREGDQLIDVIIRARPEEGDRLSRLRELNVHTRDGRFVPVGNLARISYALEDGVIWRRNRFPAITVRADIVDGVQAPDVSNRIEAEMADLRGLLPPGYRIEVAGTLESSQKSQGSIFAGMPVMLAVVLTLLMLQLHSFSRTVLVLLTAPLAMIGVSLFLLAFQMPFGFVAMLGVIALSGMIMRNAVILLDQIEQDRSQGIDPWEAVVGSTVRRFRPIMLTAITAVVGMVPLVQSLFWAPMAVAVMGGLLVATLVTLLFLPALYAVWFRVRKPKREPAA
ncbi:MAG: efflux RND transporter permease subunit [Pseudomonadota bacterium]|nr:efflux RND transporter permease subunit [Pseudomonadota bacterium]